MVGETLENRYEIIKKIGDGGMALVYLAKDTLLNRYVTIKALRPQFTDEQDIVRRFRKEAQSAAGLSHPNIVSIYDVGQYNENHYIVMEYVEGKNLKELIKEKDILPINEAVEIAMQICAALTHAHEKNIVHRDIKPHNILITKDGRIKVTDFGIARAVTDATITYTSSIVGSVHYFSPEQARGGITDVKSDIYSLGIVIYEMLTGIVPFTGESPVSIALKHLQEEIPSLSIFNKNIPIELEKITLKATEKDVSNRYQACDSLLEDLHMFAEGEEFEVGHFENPSTGHGLRRTNGVKKKRSKKFAINKKVAIFSSIVILVLISAGWGYNRMMDFMLVPEVEVPEVELLNLSQAIVLLQEAGLGHEVVEQVSSEDVPVGHVVSQFPAAGRKVRIERDIELTLSSGHDLVDIPNVVGRSELEARIILDNHGLEYSIREEYSNQYDTGVISDQIPGGGFNVRTGSTVELIISQGGQPVRMTNLIGIQYDDAVEWLDRYDLEVRYLDELVDDAPQGEVIDQFPGAEEMIQPSFPVDLVISKGPGEVEDEDIEDDYDSYTLEIKPQAKKDDIIRVKVEDKSGTRTIFDGEYEGRNVTFSITAHGSGKVTVEKMDDSGDYSLIQEKSFPE